MNELFLNENHKTKFNGMMNDLGFKDFRDPYWRTVAFIFAGNDRLFDQRNSLINFDRKEINSDKWFSGTFSGGEQRLLAMAYNLFTNQDFYEFEDGRKYYISPLEIFSGVDNKGYKLAMNAIYVRTQKVED